MAQIYDNILLKIDADLGQSTEKIGILTEKIEALRKREAEIKAEMADNKEVINEYVKAVDSGAEITQAQADAYEAATRRLASQRTELAAVTEARKAHTKEIGEESRKIQNTVIDTVEYENSLKGLASRLSVAKDELRAMNMYLEDGTTIDPKWQEKAKEVNDLNDKVKKAEETYGVFTRNVGNYSSSIMDAFSKMGGRAATIINPIKNATASLQAMCKTPAIAILSLLVTVIGKVTEALHSSEENAMQVASAFSGFKVIGDALTNTLQGLGKVLAAGATAFKNLVGRLAENHGWLVKLNDQMKERERLQEQINAQAIQERETIVRNAEDEREVSELRTKAKQKDLYTARERLAFLEQAADKEKEISKRNYDNLRLQYEIVKKQNSFTDSSTEEKRKQAEAQAAMINAQTQYYNKVRELQEGIQSARNEIAAENKARREAEKAEIEQAKKLAEDAVKTIREAALSGTDEYEIEKIRARYDELYRQLFEDSKMTQEEKYYYTIKLNEKEQAEIKAIEDRARKEREDADKQAADREKEEQAKRYTDKVRQMEDELAQTNGNAQKQYEERKAYLELLMQDETLNAEQRMQLEKELTATTVNYNQSRIASFQEYASQIGSIMSSVNQVISGIEQSQLQQYEDDNEAKKESLQRRLDAGIINQEQYAAETAKLDDELDKKKAEINRKAAIRERALSVFQIGVNTAAAIMKIWAEVPKFDFGISTGVLAALAAAAGIAQMAAVLAQPLPTARRGGLVQGATHEAGGVLIETEGDERIVSAAPSRAFPELLNLISYIGKHQLPNSGYGVRNTVFAAAAPAGYPDAGRNDYSGLADAIGERITAAIKDVKIYTAITDVKEAEAQYARVVDSAKI